MASDDSISGSRKSPANSRGDIQMLAQRKGSACHVEAKAVFDRSREQYAPTDRPFPNLPAADALDSTSQRSADHRDFSKLYSELPAHRRKVNIEFHIDSMSVQPPISTGYEMHR